MAGGLFPKTAEWEELVLELRVNSTYSVQKWSSEVYRNKGCPGGVEKPASWVGLKNAKSLSAVVHD